MRQQGSYTVAAARQPAEYDKTFDKTLTANKWTTLYHFCPCHRGHQDIQATIPAMSQEFGESALFNG